MLWSIASETVLLFDWKENLHQYTDAILYIYFSRWFRCEWIIEVAANHVSSSLIIRIYFIFLLYLLLSIVGIQSHICIWWNFFFPTFLRSFRFYFSLSESFSIMKKKMWTEPAHRLHNIFNENFFSSKFEWGKNPENFKWKSNIFQDVDYTPSSSSPVEQKKKNQNASNIIPNFFLSSFAANGIHRMIELMYSLMNANIQTTESRMREMKKFTQIVFLSIFLFISVTLRIPLFIIQFGVFIIFFFFLANLVKLHSRNS